MRIFLVILSLGVFSSCFTDKQNLNNPGIKLIQLSVNEADFYKDVLGRDLKKSSIKESFEEAEKIYKVRSGNGNFLKILEEVFNEKATSLCTELYKEKECLLDFEEKFIERRNLTLRALEQKILSNDDIQPEHLQWDETSRVFKLYYFSDKSGQYIANKLASKGIEIAFYHTYNNTQIGNQIFEDVNLILSKNMFPGYRDSVEKHKELIESIEKPKDDTVYEDISEEDWQKIMDDEVPNLSDEKQMFRKMYPLSAYLMLNINSDNMWAEGPILGYAKVTDTAIIDEYLSRNYVKNVLNRDLAFMWEASSTITDRDGVPFLALYLIKKTRSDMPFIDGSSIKSAEQGFEIGTTAAMVTLQFTKTGTALWGNMTEKSANENTAIAMTLNGKVMSAPVANSRITGGFTKITGGDFDGPGGVSHAEDIANMINAGAGKVLKLEVYSIKN